MNIAWITLWSVLSSLSTPADADPGDCEFTAPLSAVVDAAGAEVVRVGAGAGSLQIVGRPGLSEVRVQGTVCASSQELLDETRIAATREDDEVRVAALLAEPRGFLNRGSVRLDLVVEVPETVPLDVEDSSGGTEISRVAALRLDDSSGDVRVTDVTGGVRIEDSSGGIYLENIVGDVWVTDSSGEIEIQNVGGSVAIPEDSSGEIEIHNVRGSVEINEDSSGSITVAAVGRNVRIGEDSSGSIRVTDVRGDFSVGDDSSGGIRYERVGGTVTIPQDERD